jgi:hypothetical protein
MPFVGEPRRFVVHFDQTHFNQGLEITWLTGVSFVRLALISRSERA